MAAFIPAIIGGLAGLFGGGSKQQTQTNQQTTQNAQQNQQYQNQNTTTPNLSPLQQQLANLFTQGAINQFNQGTNLAPYTTQGLQQIQGQGNNARAAIANNLAARGLSFSPAAANAQTMNTLNTGNQMQSFLQQVPLLAHQLQQGNLSQLMQAFGTMPVGVTSTGTGTASGTSSGTSNTQGTQTQSTPGGGLAGLFSGIGAGLPGILSLFGGGGAKSSSGSVPNSGWSLSG